MAVPVYKNNNNFDVVVQTETGAALSVGPAQTVKGSTFERFEPPLTQINDPGSGYLYTQATNPVLDENNDVSVPGDLDVTGSATVDTNVAVGGTLDVTGATTVVDLTVSGTLTATLTGTAAVATAVTAANEAADTSCFPLFVTAATGDLGPKTNAKLAFNSSTGKLTVDGDVTADSFTLSGLQTAPVAANSTGTTGQIVIDADYIYVCVGTDTWKRAAIATWP